MSRPLSSPRLSHNNSLWALGINISHRKQRPGYWEDEELSGCPTLSNSLWHGWSCGLVHCPVGNATDPIWRVLVTSDGISSWTLLKPQHSNPNPNPLAIQLWCSDFLTPPTPLIIPHRLPASYAIQKLKLDSCKMLQKQSEVFHTFLWHFFFQVLKHNFIAYRSFKVPSRPDCIFEIHQLWQSGFSRVYSNCCLRCWTWNHKNWPVIS